MEKPSAPACFTKSTALGSSLASRDWKGTSWKLSTSVNGAPLSCKHIHQQSVNHSVKQASNQCPEHTHTHTRHHQCPAHTSAINQLFHQASSQSMSCTHIINQSITQSSMQPINKAINQSVSLSVESGPSWQFFTCKNIALFFLQCASQQLQHYQSCSEASLSLSCKVTIIRHHPMTDIQTPRGSPES